jgi:hypothetical protein
LNAAHARGQLVHRRAHVGLGRERTDAAALVGRVAHGRRLGELGTCGIAETLALGEQFQPRNADIGGRDLVLGGFGREI